MKKSISKIILVVVAIAFIASLALYGFEPFKLTGIKEGGIKQGLDLVGGTSIVYDIVDDEKKSFSEEEVNLVIEMLRDRIDRRGYTEATVSKYSDSQILVEIPGIDDPDMAAKEIGTTAELTFRKGGADGEVVITGTDVKKATAVFDDPSGMGGVAQWFIELEFNNSARKAFSEATAELAGTGNPISIMLDEDVISSPIVNTRIDSTTCIIEGDFEAEDAQELAELISAGKLPFKLDIAQVSHVGPTLGDRALETSLLAAVIGIILVMIFMIVVYRIPGVVASIALCGYVALIAFALVLFKVNLTLPGIAGIILTIGMAVDANVVIYERIKEELAIGKTVKAAVKSGFNRAIIAVIDSNVTTIIAALVLYFKGAGTVKGFGVTLGLGVVVSMITAVFVSRFLLKAFVDMNISNPWLFGVSKKKASVEDVTGGDR